MNYISFTKGQILLSKEGKTTFIYTDTDDISVNRAVTDLCDDFERVTGRRAVICDNAETADIIISTSHNGEWETFVISDDNGKVNICGSDKRGTIFGIYDLSEKIGVSPWYWWADVNVEKHNKIYATLDEPYKTKEPSVKYRGIFINDEESLADRTLNKGDYEFTELYKQVYELILRLKANLLWPAMHTCSPHFHRNIKNVENARLYGVVIGTSHCEQMLRNNQYEYFPFERKWIENNPDKKVYKMLLGDSPNPCAYVYTDIDPETGEKVYNKELIKDYWRESVEKFGSSDDMYTVGMRGLHDSPWQCVGASAPADKARVVEDAINEQRKILKDVLGDEKAPQIFVPYKEMLEIYNAGMDLPDDITLMWSDDNYGYIRQLPTVDEQKRSGGAGMYYHLSYRGNPVSYIWLCTTPFALIKEEMTKAYHNGVKRVWVANVGDIKAAERGTEYFLNLAYDIENADIHTHIKNKAVRDLGADNETALKIADNELEFQRMGYARKPEHFERNLFNLKAFGDEGMRFLSKLEGLTKQSEAIYNSLKVENKQTYFELYLYTQRAIRNAAKHCIMMDEQNVHLEDGYKNAAEQYIYRSDDGFFGIIKDMKKYHEINDGKWDHIMDSAYGYYVNRGKDKQILFDCRKEWGKNPGIGTAYEDVVLSGYIKNSCFIDIYNHYNLYVNWQAECECEYIRLSKTAGMLITDERLWVSADYDNMPKTDIETEIVFTSEFNDVISVPVKIKNNCESIVDKVFCEHNGYISIMAENFFNSKPGEKMAWEKNEYLGRESGSVVVKAYDNRLCEERIETAPYVEYDTLTDTECEIEAEIFRIPTLNERGKIRMAISIDDKAPITAECTNKYKDYSDGTDSWGRGVLNNSERILIKLPNSLRGKHTLRLYALDSDIIIEKIVLWTGKRQKTYLGPQETMLVI